MMKKVVLAFSGGLDTSFCVKYLQKEKGMEVHTAIVNTGGFSTSELEAIAHQAKRLGASSHVTLDKTQEFYQKAIRYLIFGNVLRNHTYPLSVSAERMFQAVAVAEYAQKIGADAVAHGSTGAGNDQVRFDLVFQTLAPQLEIITPIRDLKLSREQEIEYLKKQGVEANWEKAKYSINKGLWGTSVGGAETLTSDRYLPEDAFPSQLQRTDSQKISLFFEKGEPCALNDLRKNPIELIQELQAIASQYAIGRDIHVGDTIIGIKGRVGFEAAAPMIILKAHQTLEKHTLTKWQLYWKDQLAQWYGMMLHEGLYLDPVMRNIEAFLESSQARVTGKVEVALYPYRFVVLGIQSDYDLMNPAFGSYGEMNRSWTGEDAKGFTKILSNYLKIFYSIKK
ncbi:MAG: argininosuccinate synthase [Flammeovirgaceae bacterium]|nr:argininosuccinate synthase [Flammeovirgaceae bacterium]